MISRLNFNGRQKLLFEGLIFVVYICLFIFRISFETKHSLYFTKYSIYLGIVLIFPLLYLIFSYLGRKKYYILRLLLIIYTITFLVLSSFLIQIVLRKKTGNDIYVHDGIVMTEQAIKFLDEGNNFYKKTFHNTPVSLLKNAYDVNRENMILRHYVYLPFYPVFSWPFYKVISISGFFDQRLIHLFLFLVLVIIIYLIPKKRENKIFFMYLFALNPLFLYFFISGYNDIFVLFWLVLFLYLLYKNKIIWSSLFLGLACVSKQQAWLFVPLYLVYLLYYYKGIKNEGNIIFIKILKPISVLAVIFLVVFVPFLIWSPNDFIDDTLRYPSGILETSYPVAGIGFSSLLLKIGVINSRWDYFPFFYFQIIVSFIVFLFYLFFVKKRLKIYVLILFYIVFLFLFWYFSRFFNYNYLNFIISLFILFFLFKKIEDKNKT